jgi:hypothetical protein
VRPRIDPISTELRAILARPLLWLAWMPAVVISILAEFFLSTPGTLLVHRITGGLEDLNRMLLIALAIDSALCCGFMLGVAILKRLWGQLRTEAEEKRAFPNKWTNPERTSLAVGAALCALPLSYYAMLAIAVLLNGGRLPEATRSRFGALGTSFVACLALIYKLYATAVEMRLRRAASNQ